MPPPPDAADSCGPENSGETEEQQDARLVAETAAVAALPGLRHLDVYGPPTVVTLLCSALLARLDDGGALTSLHVCVSDDQLVHADCQPLGALVARSRTLTALRAEGKLDSDSIRCLAEGVGQSHSLASLSLDGNHSDGADAPALVSAALVAVVARCRTLTELELSRCGIGDAGAEALVAALEQGDRRLAMLNLSCNSFQRAGAAALARLLASDRCLIEKLDLYGCDIGEAGAQSLAESLRPNRTLIELRLCSSSLGTEGTAALTAALQANSHIPLRQLDLSHNQIDAAGATSLAAFLRINSALEELNLSSCGLDDEAVAALAAGLPAAHSLRELALGQSTFGVEGATALAAGVGACPSLTLLDLSCVQIRDGGMAALAPALTHLHTFYAAECRLTGDSAASLASLLQPDRQLQCLQLNGNAIGTAGVVALVSPLQSSSPLRTLHLEYCGIDAEGAAALGEALCRGWAVTDLNLRGNERIGHGGARALASALEQRASRCSLHLLFLERCGLTLAGALALVRAGMVVPSLRLLSLCNSFEGADESALLAACGSESHFDLQ